MGKKLNVWKSNWAKDVFLCISESPKTEKQIIRETGYAQTHVSYTLSALEREDLIHKPLEINKVPLEETINREPKRWRWDQKWDINPELIFEKMIARKDPSLGQFILKADEFKELPKLVRPYLKTIAKHPLWCSKRYYDKQEKDKKIQQIRITLIESEESYFKALRKHKKPEPLIDGWDEYKKVREKKMKFNLGTVGSGFTEYLVVNEERLNKKQKEEFNRFLKWQLMPEFAALTYYLQDKSL